MRSAKKSQIFFNYQTSSVDNKVEKFLLFRIKAFSDQKAFERLINEYGPRILRFLQNRLSRFEDAEDIYAEIWATLWTYAQNVKIESISGLLHKMARNKIAEFYGKQTRKQEHFLTEDLDISELGAPIHENIISNIDAKILKEMMKELDEDDAEIILLRYIEGYRVKEIAKYFGKNENATSAMLRRAIERLRKIIKDKCKDL